MKGVSGIFLCLIFITNYISFIMLQVNGLEVSFEKHRIQAIVAQQDRNHVHINSSLVRDFEIPKGENRKVLFEWVDASVLAQKVAQDGVLTFTQVLGVYFNSYQKGAINPLHAHLVSEGFSNGKSQRIYSVADGNLAETYYAYNHTKVEDDFYSDLADTPEVGGWILRFAE